MQLVRIAAEQGDGRATERELARFILLNADDIGSYTISTLAQRAGASEAAVVRFCKALGYHGYRDFKLAMVETRGVMRGSRLLGSDIPTNLAPDEPIGSVARKVVQINAETLVDTLSLLDDRAVDRAVEALLEAGRVHLVGFGSSSPVALDAYQRFLRLGLDVRLHADPHILAIAATQAERGDVFFGISYSGSSRDLIETFETTRERHALNVALTSYPGSPLTEVADIALLSSVRQTPVPTETVASRISQLAVIDILCVGIALRHDDHDELAQRAERIEREIAKKRL